MKSTANFFLQVGLFTFILANAGTGLAFQNKIRTIQRVSQLNHQSGGIGVFYALLIGINDYKDPEVPDLKTPVNDVEKITALLKDKYGFTVTRLFNEQASKKGIYTAFRHLVGKAKSEDSVLIYFAGHGDQDKLTGGGYWIPWDANHGDPFSYFDNIQIQKFIAGMKARHVLLVSDSCYSGTLFGTARALPPVITDKYYLELFNERSRWGMTSGNFTPVSDRGTGGHSIFAYQLIKALGKNSKPYISTQELYTRFASIVANNSEQTPICRPIKNAGDQGGEFVFIMAGGPEPDPDPAFFSVEANVENAEILVDDRSAGKTPLKNYEISPGEHRITVTSRGYDDYQRTYTFHPGRSRTINVLLSRVLPVNSTLAVDTVPGDAVIKIMTIPEKYQRGMELDPGKYHVRVSAPGYETQNLWIKVGRGEDKTIAVQLKKDSVTLPNPGDTWTEPVTGMVFVWVPEECFQMGQTQSEKDYLIKEYGQEDYDKYCTDEHPRHRVCVDGFWMAAKEVTRDQFALFIRETGYRTDADKKGKAWIKNKDTNWKWEETSGHNWENPGYSQTGTHPVAAVSWNDAKAFIKWLSKKSNQTFALPTEAQWEYAVRGGTTGMRFWGRDDENACTYANIADKDNWSPSFPCSDGYKFTAPAGSFRSNPFGLYDMLGNLWEWCEDVYDKNAYSKHVGKNPVITSGGTSRVVRGGSWNVNPWIVRAAYRIRNGPDNAFSNLGFRLCAPRVR